MRKPRPIKGSGSITGSIGTIASVIPLLLFIVLVIAAIPETMAGKQAKKHIIIHTVERKDSVYYANISVLAEIPEEHKAIQSGDTVVVTRKEYSGKTILELLFVHR